MNNGINSCPMGNFMILSDIIRSGIIKDGTRICSGFLDDGKISENEKAFLASLEKDLQEIKNNMYSDETKQENPKLTIKQINDILLPFFRKYSEVQKLNLSNE